jgi:hypothetical protein
VTSGPVLIAYDGSPDARKAIDEVAKLLPGAQSVVLYARQPMEGLAAHLEGHPALKDLRDVEKASLDASERIAFEGANRRQSCRLPTNSMRLSSFSALEAAVGCGRPCSAARR